MAKYRIKRTFDEYVVQKKTLFFWCNPYREFRRHHGIAKTFKKYDDAKKFLETQMYHDKMVEELKRERGAFKTRYYYPPLPEKEPIDD